MPLDRLMCVYSALGNGTAARRANILTEEMQK